MNTDTIIYLVVINDYVNKLNVFKIIIILSVFYKKSLKKIWVQIRSSNKFEFDPSLVKTI